jgi:H+/Cl- antiporter ClcA
MTIGMVGFFGLLFALVVFSLGVLGTVFWIWMLVDCATKETSQGNDKLIWILIILFTHLLGAALYFFVRRPKRMAGG